MRRSDLIGNNEQSSGDGTVVHYINTPCETEVEKLSYQEFFLQKLCWKQGGKSTVTLLGNAAGSLACSE